MQELEGNSIEAETLDDQLGLVDEPGGLPVQHWQKVSYIWIRCCYCYLVAYYSRSRIHISSSRAVSYACVVRPWVGCRVGRLLQRVNVMVLMVKKVSGIDM